MAVWPQPPPLGRQMSRRGQVSAFLFLTLVAGCSVLPIGPGEVQELLCSFAVSSGGPAPVIGVASVFDGGLAEVQEGKKVIVPRLSAPQLKRVGAVVADDDFRQEVNRLALELATPTCYDCSGVSMYYSLRGSEYSLEVPTEEMSPVLRSHLSAVDSVS